MKSKPSPRYAPGQMVRVLPEERIRGIIDSENRLDGCLFMEQMWQYCGQKFKIKIIVKNIFFHQMVKPRSPIYIIQDLNNKDLRCEGKVPSYDNRCDRYCNLVWHEKWLQEA